MDEQTPPPAIAWWQSKIVVGLSVTLVTDLVHIFHLTKYLTQDQITDLADAGLQVLGILSIVYAARARLQQKAAAPLALTKTKADAMNASRSVPPTTGDPP
jgi:hypothetical protein